MAMIRIGPNGETLLARIDEVIPGRIKIETSSGQMVTLLLSPPECERIIAELEPIALEPKP